MAAEKIDLFSIYGINPNEWYFMHTRRKGLDSIVIQPPHAERHYANKWGKAKITKPCGEVLTFPAFKGEILQSPGVIDICSLAPFSEYEAKGYQVELIEEL